MNIFRILLFMFAALAASGLDTPAYAYLDPGTGAMILQAIFGGVAGALVFGKIFWGRIKDFFARSAAFFGRSTGAADTDGTPPPD